MNERESADRLIEDLEKASASADSQGQAILPDGYSQRLEIARRISRADYSNDSRVQDALLRRLKTRAEKEFPSMNKRAMRIRNLSISVRWAAGAAVLLFLILSLNWVLGNIRPATASPTPTPTSNSIAPLVEKIPTSQVVQKPAPTGIPPLQCHISVWKTIPPDPSASVTKPGWSQYENKTYGFAFSAPTGWTVVEGPHYVCVFQPQEPYRVLLINSMKAVEAVSLQRTATGAGDVIQRGSVRFLGQEVSRDVLVYQGKDKAVLYANAQNIQRGDLIFTLSLDDFNPDYDAAGLSGDLQNQVDQIVASFALKIDQPPAAQLEINGKTQTAGIGTYCWNIQQQGDTAVNQCADRIGVPTAREALLVTLPARARLSLPLAAPPDGLELAIMPVVPNNEIDPNPDNPYRWWQPGGGQGQGLPLQANPEFDLPALDNGLYVLQVSARWRDPGDVVYGFLIQVGPQGATPVPLSNAAAAATQPAPSKTSYPTFSPLTRIGKGVVKSFALSPDGRWVAVSTPLGVYQYHAGTWEQAWFSPSGANAAAMAFSHNSQRLALSTAAGEMELLDAETGESSTRMSNTGDNFAWSPDDSRLVSGGDCHRVTIWDANSAEKVKELLVNQCSEGYSGINVAWSSGGEQIYAALPGNQSLAWDARTLLPLDSFKLEAPSEVTAPAFIPSPSENILALFDWMSSSNLIILDGSTGKWLYTLEGPSGGTLTSVAWSPDGKRLAVGYGASNETWVWDTASRQVIKVIKGFHSSSRLSWFPDGQALFGLMDAAGKLYTVDVRTGKELNGLDGHTPLATYLSWTADGLVTYNGPNLAWGETPGSQPVEPRDLTWWDVQTGQPFQGPQIGEAGRIFRPDLKSPEGSRYISSDQILDIKSQQVLVRLQGASSGERSHDLGAWSPDGKSVASADSLFTQPVVIWDPITGKLLKTLQANTGTQKPYLDWLAWSPDSSWLAGGGSLMDQASGSHAGIILVWDAATGEQVQLLTSAMYQDTVKVMVWSPDGKRLAAGLYSGQIVIWDMAAFIPSAVLQGHAGVVSGLAWSPDRSMLASSAEDGTLLIWKVNQ